MPLGLNKNTILERLKGYLNRLNGEIPVNVYLLNSKR